MAPRRRAGRRRVGAWRRAVSSEYAGTASGRAQKKRADTLTRTCPPGAAAGREANVRTVSLFVPCAWHFGACLFLRTSRVPGCGQTENHTCLNAIHFQPEGSVMRVSESRTAMSPTGDVRGVAGRKRLRPPTSDELSVTLRRMKPPHSCSGEWRGGPRGPIFAFLPHSTDMYIQPTDSTACGTQAQAPQDRHPQAEEAASE